MIEIPYLHSFIAEKELIIENEGECALELLGEKGNCYIVIKSYLGFTTIFYWGPIILDTYWLPSKYIFEFTRMKYGRTKIRKKITSYLHDASNRIWDVNIITEEEAKSHLRDDMKYYLDHYQEIEDEGAD